VRPLFVYDVVVVVAICANGPEALVARSTR